MRITDLVVLRRIFFLFGMSGTGKTLLVKFYGSVW